MVSKEETWIDRYGRKHSMITRDGDPEALCICGHKRSDHITVKTRALPETKNCTKCPEWKCVHFYAKESTYMEVDV